MVTLVAAVSLSQRLRKALGLEEHSEGAKSLAEDEPVDVVLRMVSGTQR